MKFKYEYRVWEDYATAEWPLAVFDNYMDALFFAAEHMKDNGKAVQAHGYFQDS